MALDMLYVMVSSVGESDEAQYREPRQQAAKGGKKSGKCDNAWGIKPPVNHINHFFRFLLFLFFLPCLGSGFHDTGATRRLLMCFCSCVAVTNAGNASVLRSEQGWDMKQHAMGGAHATRHKTSAPIWDLLRYTHHARKARLNVQERFADGFQVHCPAERAAEWASHAQQALDTATHPSRGDQPFPDGMAKSFWTCSMGTATSEGVGVATDRSVESAAATVNSMALASSVD